MTQFLPPNLLALFAPRDPIPFKPPIGMLTWEKDREKSPYVGIAPYVNLFEDPKDTPPPTRGEIKVEKKRRRIREKAEKRALEINDELKAWDPHSDPNAVGDAFKTLFISRINYDTSESKLRREFESYGKVKKINMVKNVATGRSRGYAFIEYERERDMHAAYKSADGKKIDGRRVLVDVERGRTVKGWRPRRLGGGLGSTRASAEEGEKPPGRENRDQPGRAREAERERPQIPRERSRDKEPREKRDKRDRDRDRTRDRDRDRDRDREKRRRDDRDGRDRRDRDRDRDRKREKDEKPSRSRDEKSDAADGESKRDKDRESRHRHSDRSRDKDKDRESRRERRRDRDGNRDREKSGKDRDTKEAPQENNRQSGYDNSNEGPPPMKNESITSRLEQSEGVPGGPSGDGMYDNQGFGNGNNNGYYKENMDYQQDQRQYDNKEHNEFQATAEEEY
ncbi:unnamed protein product [Clavelina lepadiformis]|uniref:U1 small nuclear ribonucleoprotein 70 kDa n=1 Tax=Clavelina lepadiformis TaxID=159417 RepID=A0ABP0H3N4_CLALP